MNPVLLKAVSCFIAYFMALLPVEFVTLSLSLGLLWAVSCVAGLQVSIVGLERALHHYTMEPSETPFDMKSVPLATQPMAEQKPGSQR